MSPAAEGWTWERREARARFCGEQAAAVLAGRRQRVIQAEGINLSNRLYVILRASPTAVPVSGRTTGWVGSWRDCIPFVGQPIHDLAIFHGFASQREAQAYWAAAGNPGPLLRLV